MNIHRKLLVSAAASMVMLVACTHADTHGHLKEDEALASVHVGETNKVQAKMALGSPSSESSFGPTTWYYVSDIKETSSLLPPKIIDQRVVEIGFDAQGIVQSIKEYSLKDSKDFQTATRVTPSEGQQLGFFEQIFANLGRFNKDSNSTSNDHSHQTVNPGGYPGPAR